VIAPVPLNVAYEDSLSGVVIDALLNVAAQDFAVGNRFTRGGSGYLRRTIGGFNQAARGTPFLVLTDLDASPCAPDLLDEWLPDPRHPNLIFRVAATEVEAWLIGDRVRFAQFFGVPSAKIPGNVDAIEDPKAFIVNLVQTSRRSAIVRDMAPRAGSQRQTGPEFNIRMIEFAQSLWRARTAADHSDSLARALTALDTFQPQWAA